MWVFCLFDNLSVLQFMALKWKDSETQKTLHFKGFHQRNRFFAFKLTEKGLCVRVLAVNDFW